MQGGGGGIVSARRRRAVSFMPQMLYALGKTPQYPLDSRLDGPQSQSQHYGEENFIDKRKFSFLYRESNSSSLVVQPIA
jgi:hypothetical protein